MAIIGGLFLRSTATVLRLIQLLASIFVLAIFSYFLAILADHSLPIYARWKAVEGMSGAAVLYGIFCVLLTLFLGGIAFFGFLAVLLDICFIGCYIVIAWFTRHTLGKCSGTVNTVLGTGAADSTSTGYGANGFGFGSGENLTYEPKLKQACRLEKGVFAVAIINVGLFAITAFVQVLLVRHHRKEKKFGPGPSNNYTAGSGRRPFWRRNKKATRDTELGTVGTVGAGGLAAEKHHHDRQSHDTNYTGVTNVDHTAGHHNNYVPTHQATTATNY